MQTEYISYRKSRRGVCIPDTALLHVRKSVQIVNRSAMKAIIMCTSHLCADCEQYPSTLHSWLVFIKGLCWITYTWGRRLADFSLFLHLAFSYWCTDIDVTWKLCLNISEASNIRNVQFTWNVFAPELCRHMCVRECKCVRDKHLMCAESNRCLESEMSTLISW